MSAVEDIIDSVDFQGHLDNLVDIMTPRYFDLLEIAWQDAQSKMPHGRVLGTWDIRNPAVREMVKELAKRVVGISETTRDDIRGVLDRAFAADKTPGIDEIARQLRDAGGLSSLSRARTVARTETMHGYGLGSLTAYKEANVNRVELLDGSGDPECAARNGRIVSLGDAYAELAAEHPNGTLAFAPVLD